MTVPLPNVSEALNGGGPPSVAWRNWLETVNRALTDGSLSVAALQALVTDLQAQVDALDAGNVRQGEGIALYGSLQDTLTIALRALDDSGAGALLAVTRDDFGRVSGTKPATITGTAGRVTVADGDAAAGLPTIDLSPVPDAGGGTLLRIVRDDWGRIIGTSTPTTTDLAEGSNLYHTTARARAAAVADTIADAVTDVAPSQNAVFDALAGKAAIPKGYIDGLQMQWVSGTALTVTSGAAYIEASGNIVSAPSAIAKTGLSLSASTWYHVYLYLNAGTPDIEIVTTAPVAYSGTARSKTGDATRRYVGSVLTSAGGGIFSFKQSGGRVQWRQSTAVDGFRALSGGNATTETTVSLSLWVPETAAFAQLRLVNNDGSGVLRTGTSDDGFTLGAGQGIAQIQVNSNAFIDHPIDASRALTYLYAPAPAGANAFIDVLGYTFER